MDLVIIKNPLVISLNGGLGNQLFMLFAGMSKAKDENRSFLILLEENKRPFYFNNFMAQFYNKVLNYNNNIQINSESNNYYNEPFHHYQEIPNNCDLIKGYFQSYKYFIHNYDYLEKEFKIKEMKSTYKLGFKAIGLHFRLGDYLQLSHFHRVLSFVYYIKAISYLKTQLENFDEFAFLIFGEKNDNPIIDEFLHQINKNLDKPLYVIKSYERFPNCLDYEELFYMMNCNHLIMANSTFSWFGAFCNDNSNKIIIRPHNNKWFAEQLSNYNLSDLCPNDWIPIDY